VQGVAPDAHLVILKVLDSTGHGTWSSVLEALRYAADINVDVVNMSFSESFAVDSEDGRLLQAELDRAVARLRSTGAVVVASAGNNSVALDANTLELPAQARDVIAVSATGPIEGRQFDHFASYSNYGRDVVDVAAPGGDLVSERSYPCDMVLSAAARTNEGPNQWAWEAGTSTAAPHVAGVAALAMSRYRGMQAAFVERWIARTSDDILARGPDAQSGWGRVNAARATGFWSPPAASPR
jgi:subtilisin family serine protease